MPPISKPYANIGIVICLQGVWWIPLFRGPGDQEPVGELTNTISNLAIAFGLGTSKHYTVEAIKVLYKTRGKSPLRTWSTLFSGLTILSGLLIHERSIKLLTDVTLEAPNISRWGGGRKECRRPLKKWKRVNLRRYERVIRLYDTE